MKQIAGALEIERLRLSVLLGTGEAERSCDREVEVDLRFLFNEIPSCCRDDNGAFLCYDILAKELQAFVADKEFRLIEYLAMQLHAAAREHLRRALPETEHGIAVRIRVSKLTFPEKMPFERASFTYTDE